MVNHAIPEILLNILLFTSLIGNLLGMNSNASLIPETTAFAPSIALKPAVMPGFAVAPEITPNISLQDFIQAVENGQRDQVVGVYVPGVLALPVGQQPKGNAAFVTREPHRATQFNLAGRYGTVGILAHNDLAGSEFSGIEIDQYAIIVYGDGHLDYYLVNEVQKYQALSPTSTFSDFVNLNGTGERLTAGELFTRIYGAGDRLVFQTCLEGAGDPSWGRMFIIAEPATAEVQSIVQQTSFLLEFASFGLAYH